MTNPGAWYPELRPTSERSVLEQFLDQFRGIVTSKLADLDQVQASARVLQATDLTVGGIVKHLASAEDRWFQGKLLGLELPRRPSGGPVVRGGPRERQGGSLCT